MITWMYSDYMRKPNREVTLICLLNLEKPIDFIINEAKKYLTRILVQSNLINLISGNVKIDDFIQEMHDYDDIIFEWIPYDQFNNIEEISRATRRQPFNNHAHDTDIVLDTCEGVRPKINEPEALGSYTDLKKKCWD
uniref:Uncharacterized protein n=1 Tax=Rhizophagus irregularis (strain DAOM 181602 / DAOM 197198 / MUCL 43194) TaxID=747089 RepID=U9TN47_RHIID